jgi:hypothetical protein
MILQRVSWIILKWVVYILDDEAIGQAIDFTRTWIQLFLREGEKILEGKDTIRYIVAGSMLSSAPTTVSYFRYFLRMKAREINMTFVESALERHEEKFSAISERLQSRYSQTKKGISKGVQNAVRKSLRKPTVEAAEVEDR